MSWDVTYFNTVTELFTLRASASATAPLSSISLPHSLHLRAVTVHYSSDAGHTLHEQHRDTNRMKGYVS
jgi:hypothetical protein